MTMLSSIQHLLIPLWWIVAIEQWMDGFLVGRGGRTQTSPNALAEALHVHGPYKAVGLVLNRDDHLAPQYYHAYRYLCQSPRASTRLASFPTTLGKHNRYRQHGLAMPLHWARQFLTSHRSLRILCFERKRQTAAETLPLAAALNSRQRLRDGQQGGAVSLKTSFPSLQNCCPPDGCDRWVQANAVIVSILSGVTPRRSPLSANTGESKRSNSEPD